MHKINANFAVGLNCPVSIELIVFLETPTIFANSVCEKPFSFLIFLNYFLILINYPYRLPERIKDIIY